MTDLDVFRDEYLVDLKGSNGYKAWIRDNCGKTIGGVEYVSPGYV